MGEILTQEQRDMMLIRMETQVKLMYDGMTTGDGQIRCTQHNEQLTTLFRRVEGLTKILKGMAVSLLVGGTLALAAAVLTHIAK